MVPYELWTSPEGRKLIHQGEELRQILTSLDEIEKLIKYAFSRGKSKIGLTVANVLFGFSSSNWILEWNPEEFKTFTKGIGVILGKRYKVVDTAIWPSVQDIIGGSLIALSMEVYQVELFPKP